RARCRPANPPRHSVGKMRDQARESSHDAPQRSPRHPMSPPGASGTPRSPWDESPVEYRLMPRWFWSLLGVVAAAASLAAAGQRKPAAITLPQTPWGDPDLQGTWIYATMTPLERPRDFGDKATLRARKRDASPILRRTSRSSG